MLRVGDGITQVGVRSRGHPARMSRPGLGLQSPLNRRGFAKFRTTTVPTDPTSGQYQASVTDDVGVPALYCDWDAMIFCRTPPVVGTGTPPDPTTTPPATTPPEQTTPPSTPPQSGTSPWRGGMGCGWR